MIGAQPNQEWLTAAEHAGRLLKPETKWQARQWRKSANGMNTTRSVYAVLLYDPNRSDPFGIYVGMTHNTPPRRYKHHTNELVQKFGQRLLPYVYRHLNPMVPAEAKSMERQLYLKLKSVVGWVSMGR